MQSRILENIYLNSKLIKKKRLYILHYYVLVLDTGMSWHNRALDSFANGWAKAMNALGQGHNALCSWDVCRHRETGNCPLIFGHGHDTTDKQNGYWVWACPLPMSDTIMWCCCMHKNILRAILLTNHFLLYGLKYRYQFFFWWAMI